MKDPIKNNQEENYQEDLSKLFINQPLPACILDEKGVIHLSNQALSSLFPHFFLTGYSLSMLLTSEERHQFDSRYKAIFQQPENKRFIASFLKSQKETLYYQLHFQSLETSPPLLLAVFSDISEERKKRMKQERELKTERILGEIYRILFKKMKLEDSIKEIVKILEKMDHYCTVNIFIDKTDQIQQFSNIKNAAYKELLFQWSDKGNRIPCLDGCLKEMELSLRREHECDHCNIRFQHQNNYLFVGRLQYNETNYGLITIELSKGFSPLDEEQKQLDRLRQELSTALFEYEQLAQFNKINNENARLAEIVKHSSVVLIQWEKQSPGNILYISENCTQWGYKAREILNKPMSIKELVSPAHLSLLQTKNAEDEVITIMGKNGSSNWVKIHRMDTDNPDILSVIFSDIGHYKNVEDSLHRADKLRALGELSGGVAHDFNNILTGIMGSADLALNFKGENDLPREELENILSASERAKGLIKRIMSFSQQSTDKREQQDLLPLIKETVKLIRAGSKPSIEFEEQYSDGTFPVMISGSNIHGAILNLLNNARYALPESGGKILIHLRRETFKNHFCTTTGILMPGNYAVLDIQDNGCGIPESYLEKIMEPFFTTRRHKGGSGLGLSVVFSILKKNDGEILIQSEEGIGSIFTLYLPLIDLDK